MSGLVCRVAEVRVDARTSAGAWVTGMCWSRKMERSQVGQLPTSTKNRGDKIPIVLWTVFY
jgi:hypothetical protein